MFPQIKNISDFICTVNLVNVIGRKAHNVRDNLFYDCYSRVVYSSGHAVVILDHKKLEAKLDNNKVSSKEIGS